MSNKETVNSKSRKDLIWDAYKNAIKKQEELEALVHNPVKKAEQQKKQEVITKSEKIKTSTLENIVEKIQKDIDKANEEVSNYQEIKNAIQLKEQELKDLFEIETNAYSLTALINAQEEAKVKHEAEMNAKLEELKELEADSKAKIKENEAESKAEMKEEKDKFNQKVTRAEEEWEYEFARKKMLEENKLQDELADMKKEYDKQFEEREMLISKRSKEVSEKEANIESLQTQIKELEEKLVTVEQEVTDKVTKKLVTSHGFETRYIKKDYESKEALLQSKVDTLTESLARETADKEKLSIKLDEAYSKLESLANKTVEGSSNQKMISSLENVLKTNNNSGK